MLSKSTLSFTILKGLTKVWIIKFPDHRIRKLKAVKCSAYKGLADYSSHTKESRPNSQRLLRTPYMFERLTGDLLAPSRYSKNVNSPQNTAHTQSCRKTSELCLSKRKNFAGGFKNYSGLIQSVQDALYLIQGCPIHFQVYNQVSAYLALKSLDHLITSNRY